VKKRSKIIQEQKHKKQNKKSDMDIHFKSEQSNQFAQQTIQVQMQADAEKQNSYRR
jgi:hypothetical protein